MSEGYVYILGVSSKYITGEDKTGNYFKIGSTENPEKRRSDLQSACPYALYFEELIGPYEHYESLEGTLHVVFNERKLHGEWFQLKDEHIGQIQNFELPENEERLHEIMEEEKERSYQLYIHKVAEDAQKRAEYDEIPRPYEMQGAPGAPEDDIYEYYGEHPHYGVELYYDPKSQSDHAPEINLLKYQELKKQGPLLGLDISFEALLYILLAFLFIAYFLW